MNLFVTGAGLVGCHVAKLIAGRGHSVVLYDLAPNRAYVASVAPSATVVQGDVGDLPGLLDVLRKHAVDAIVHSAFLIGERINAHPHAGMIRAAVPGAQVTVLPKPVRGPFWRHEAARPQPRAGRSWL